jgi:hypothetical protein
VGLKPAKMRREGRETPCGNFAGMWSTEKLDMTHFPATLSETV